MNRSERAAVAAETVKILQEGGYPSRQGAWVPLRDSINRTVAGTVLYRPDEELRQRALEVLGDGAGRRERTRVSVTGETTLEAASRCIQEGGARPAALNFASAKNPGGGFLGGSQAQEESLARASALTASIAPVSEMYEYNRQLSSAYYSDYMIYSPDVAVFRTDEDELLEVPYALSFITAPAVNAGVVRERETEAERADERIEQVMRRRIHRIAQAAILNGHRTLILGAYGCGVFRNRPADVAHWFREVLSSEDYRGAFDELIFAVYDRSRSQETFRAFSETMSSWEL